MAIATEALAPAAPARGRSWRLIAALLVGALTVILAVRWLTDDRALAGGGLKVEQPGTVGETVYVDADVFAAHGVNQSFHIDVRSIKARVTENTAAATITFGACAQRQPHTRIGASAETGSACTSVTPLRSGSLLVDSAKVEVLLEVTPRKPGVVHIEGIELSYRRGVRFGHQRIGSATVVTVKH